MAAQVLPVPAARGLTAVDELDEPIARVCDDEHQPWEPSWACVPRTVSQDCQVIRRITRVIASPINGSAMSRPSATTAALATTARLTYASARAWAPSATR